MSLLLMKKCFFDAIRAGTKVTTIRRWKTKRVKPGSRAFCPGLGWLAVKSVEPVELNHLSEQDAQADGFETLAGMLGALEAIYPETSTDGKTWFRVKFKLSR